MSEPRKENRLSQSLSPYLLQHRFNPVDWYPWGDEALEKAKKEQKPILLSIGYSTCHWCHVMEEDAFSVDEVAEILNRHFVSIKVDREERPDLDALYQGVVQLMGRGGGWPLTVFLTPECLPFFGGTYFPPEDAHGLPGFSRVLLSIIDAWNHRREDVEKSASSFEEGLSGYMRLGLGEGDRAIDGGDLERACEVLLEGLDEESGGFFGAPKFPHPMELSFLLRCATLPLGLAEATRIQAKEAVRLSLDRMARGGIHDQLGGGFHRYCVDAAWEVPHFEKMLYDNALLLRLYAEASLAFSEPRFGEVARRIFGWLEREMKGRDGAFWTAQDVHCQKSN